MPILTVRRPRWRTTFAFVLLLVTLIFSLVFSLTSHVLAAEAAPAGVAPDGPGALSHFDLSRKDCLGTAQNTTSKVWLTGANGVLSDVYYPTADNTNVETLRYVVTDGSTFTTLKTRDTTTTVQLLDTHPQPNYSHFSPHRTH